MSVKIKSRKQLKREQVIPFSGEENFVVPRKGGYGMSDNEDYITIARANFSDSSYLNLSRVSLDEVGGGTVAGSEGSTDTLLNGGGSNLRIDTTSGGGSTGGTTSDVGTTLGGGQVLGSSNMGRYLEDNPVIPIDVQYNKPTATYATSPNWRTATTCQELKDYKDYLEGYLASNPNLSPSDMQKYITESQGINMAIPIACAVSVSDKPRDYPPNYGSEAPPPPSVDLPSYSDTYNMSCNDLKNYKLYLENYLGNTGSYTSSEKNRLNSEYQMVNGKIATVCYVAPPPPPPIEPIEPIVTLPTFPNWDTLDCSALSQYIKEIDGKMAVETFTAQVASLYNTQLAKAKSVYINKGCDVVAPPPPTPIDYPPNGGQIPPPPPPMEEKVLPPSEPKGTGTTVTSTTTFTPTFGGGGFGASPSGGGGGGEQAVEEPKKKDYSWLWLLLIAGGIYLATRKKKGVQ